MNVVLYDLTSPQSSIPTELNARQKEAMSDLQGAPNASSFVMGLQEYLYCSRLDSEHALFVPGFGDFVGDCATVPSSLRLCDMSLNYAALVLSVVAIITFLVMLISSGIRQIGEGAYLSFTRELPRKPVGIFLTYALIVVTVLLLARHLWSIFAEFSTGVFRQGILFFELYLTQIILLLYSAISLRPSSDPSFNHKDEAFKGLRFCRNSWSVVFSQTNLDFWDNLQRSLWKAKCGKMDKLKALVDGDGCSSVDKVLETCYPVDDSDSEFEDGSSSEAADDEKGPITAVKSPSPRTQSRASDAVGKKSKSICSSYL
jgi:hypothetical protein